MYGVLLRENREIPPLACPVDHRSGPSRERCGGKPGMNEGGKSDERVGPARPANKAACAAAESVEGRRSAEEKRASKTRPGRSAGLGAPSALDRVREVARRDKDARFTALLHYIDLDRLRTAYRAISPKAAAGVDGVTWADYEQDLEANLQDLHRRLHAGATGLGRHGGHTSRRRTGGCGRSASPRGRTRSSSGPSSRCSTPCMRRSSGACPMGSGRGAARIRRWMRSRSESSGRR